MSNVRVWHMTPTLGSGFITRCGSRASSRSRTSPSSPDCPRKRCSPICRRCRRKGTPTTARARGLWQLTPDGREAYVDRVGGRRQPSWLPRGAGREVPPLPGDERDRSRRCAPTGSCATARPTTTPTRPTTRTASSGSACSTTRPSRSATRSGRSPSDSTAMPPASPAAASALENGDQRMFTGVMCGSYHDVWMELHEDLHLDAGYRPRRRRQFLDVPTLVTACARRGTDRALR